MRHPISPPARFKGLAAAIATAALLSSFASRADAAPVVTFNFAGGSGAGAFTGSFSYDLATPEVAVGDPFISLFAASAAHPMTFSITTAGGNYSSASIPVGSVEVINASIDRLVVYISGPASAVFQLILGDETGTALSSDALPTDLDLSRFSAASLDIAQSEDGSVSVFGPLTSLTLAPSAVPEPSTLVLAGLGSVGLLGYGWNRRRRTAA